MIEIRSSISAARATRRAAALLFLGSFTLACTSSRAGQRAGIATPGAANAPTHLGTLFIVGGGPQPASLVSEFVALAGGAGRARIVVFAMASVDGRTSGEEKARDLRALGATAINVYVNAEQANTDSVAHLLDSTTGVWFGGGDQALLTRALLGTRTERMIHRRYEAGAVIGGTSAGAAVMSATMLTGDERHPGGERPVRDSSGAYMTIARDNMVLSEGFGLLTNAIVDQHFLRRKRHNRLISVTLEREPHLGVGIDESTALIVEPSGRWRIAGASVAIVYDARRSSITRSGTTLGAASVVMHVLPAGSSFLPSTGEASLPARQ